MFLKALVIIFIVAVLYCSVAALVILPAKRRVGEFQEREGI